MCTHREKFTKESSDCLLAGAAHSSILARRIHGQRCLRARVHAVQSRTDGGRISTAHMMGMEALLPSELLGSFQLLKANIALAFFWDRVRVGNCPKRLHYTCEALLLVKAEKYWGRWGRSPCSFLKSSLLLFSCLFPAAVHACRIFVPSHGFSCVLL